MRSFVFKLFSVTGIICLGTIVYSNTFHASFQLDDLPSIIQNFAIKDLRHLDRIWDFWPCRFLTYLSIALNFHFYRLDVFSYHVFNLMVHLGSALLVYWLVLLTLATPVMKGNKIAPYAHSVALFAGLIFVSHPIQTEAVTYIVQRATSLASFFYLASICFYAKARLLQDSRSHLYGGCYILALIAVVMAMFTKEMAITLPLAIWLYEASFFKAKKDLKWKNLTPFLMTVVIIPLTMALTKYIDFHHLRRAGEQPQDIDSVHYLMTQFRVMVTYLRLLILPVNQNLDYDYPASRSFFEWGTMGSFFLLAGVLYIAGRWHKDYRLLSFSIFFFFLTLLPESSILPIKDVIFEHRLYLPLAGYSLFLVSGLYYLGGKRGFVVTGMILSLIIGVNAVLTYERNKVWQDYFHLWDDTVRKSPRKERPRNNLGISNDNMGHYAEALKDYQESILLNPKFPEPHYNSGVVYHRLGQLDRAIAEYDITIRLKPDYADAYNNLGLIDDARGNYAKAVMEYAQAIKLNPYKEGYYRNRGNMFFKQGKLNEALADFNKALYLDSGDAIVYGNRALLFDKEGDFAQAISDYTGLIGLNPKEGAYHVLRGNEYYKEKEFNEALEDYGKAIELNPDNAPAYDNQAVTYYQLKEYGKARDSLRKLEQLPGPYDPQRISKIKKALLLESF